LCKLTYAYYAIQQVRKETDNLFFVCLFSTYLWSLCKLKLGFLGAQIGTLQDEISTLQTTFRKKRKSTILAKLVLATTFWHIWKERNARVDVKQFGSQSHSN